MSARTVTLCGTLHVPDAPPVNASAALLPAAPDGPCTDTTPCNAAGTDTVTVAFTPGSVFKRSVYDACDASPPNSVTATAVADSVTPAVPVTTASEMLWSVPCGSAPPPTLVPKLATSNPFRPLPSGPSTTSIVLPPADAFAVSSSVATCTVPAALPVNVTFGVSVVAPESVTPVFKPSPEAGASDQSAVDTFTPRTRSGTSITSPVASARPKLTVNPVRPPAGTVPACVRASDTSVASSSVMLTSANSGEPAWNRLAGVTAACSRSVSVTSSAPSSAAVSTSVPDVAPAAIEMLLAPASV